MAASRPQTEGKFFSLTLVRDTEREIFETDMQMQTGFSARVVLSALAATLMLLTALMACFAQRPQQLPAASTTYNGEPVNLWEQKGTLHCNQVDKHVAYWTRNKPLGHTQNVAGAAACRLLCFKNPRCMAWTWSLNYEGFINSCWLRELDQDELPMKKHAPKSVSGGLPCNMQQMLAPGSLYCFALTIPNSYEQGLLAMQHQRSTSIFACEEYAIFSNASMTIAPGVETHLVNTSLACQFGGEFGTALNLDIFREVWKAVVQETRYNLHEWTVKVDPDAVFFASRLRAVLPHHPEDIKGVYLNNCKFGMHGPIEVLSRRAVYTWAVNEAKCRKFFNKTCNGDCGWGEDIYVDQCFLKVLKVRRDNEWSLLAEDHCASDPLQPVAWTPALCKTNHVAFHPFKSPALYTACMAVSRGSAMLMQ